MPWTPARTPRSLFGALRRKLALAAACTGLAACAPLPTRPADAGCAPAAWLFAGTDGQGLRAFAFDACTGRLTSAGVVADLAKPRWTVAHPRRPVLYAAVDGSGAEGSIVSLGVDAASGRLTPLGTVGAGGSGTTHLLLDERSNTLLAANFGSGSVSSLALRDDGLPGPLVSVITANGSGPHRRQASPHAHGVTMSPDGRFVLVADLGADRVFVHALDAAQHRLQADDPARPRSHATGPGCGPRRVVFGPGGRQAYVLCELTAEILTLQWDAASGRLSPLQVTPMSSPGYAGARSASELALSADGRHLYAANRAEDELLVYRIDAASGALQLLQRQRTGGQTPWAFVLDPSGRWLLVANHRSNRIQVLRVEASTGLLTLTDQGADSPGPVSLGFGPGAAAPARL